MHKKNKKKIEVNNNRVIHDHNMQDENRIKATIKCIFARNTRDKGDKYGGAREIRQRTVSVCLLVLFLIREKWKCPRESGRARYQVA